MINSDVIYLASPYTGPTPAVCHARYRAAAYATHALWALKLQVFSPILYSHHIHLGTPEHLQSTHKEWMCFDLTILSACQQMLILDLPGWALSSGVHQEMEFAEINGIPFDYVSLKYPEVYTKAMEQLREHP